MTQNLSIEQLVVLSSFAALNHGLYKNLTEMIDVIPYWITDDDTLNCILTLLLWGVGNKTHAIETYNKLKDENVKNALLFITEEVNG